MKFTLPAATLTLTIIMILSSYHSANAQTVRVLYGPGGPRKKSKLTPKQIDKSELELNEYKEDLNKNHNQNQNQTGSSFWGGSVEDEDVPGTGAGAGTDPVLVDEEGGAETEGFYCPWGVTKCIATNWVPRLVLRRN